VALAAGPPARGRARYTCAPVSVRRSLPWLFVLASALALSEVLFYSALAPLLPHYAHRLHLSKGRAGLLTASYAIGALAASVPLGLAVARLGARRTAITSAFVLALTSLAFGFSQSAVTLDAARFTQGIAGSGVWIGALTWLVGAAPSRRRGEIVGGMLGIAIAGAMLGPVVGSLAQLSGTRTVFGAVAVAIALLGLIAAATPGIDEQARRLERRALRGLLGDRRLLAGVCFTAIPASLFGVLNVLAPLRLSSAGVGSVAIGAVFLASAALEGGASPVFGRLSDRLGPWSVIRIGLSSSALLAFVLPLPDVAWLIAATTALAGIAFGMSYVPASALMSSAADSHELDHGLAYALWNLAWALGVTLGSAVGAPLAQATSDELPYWLLALVCLAGLLTTRRSSRRSAEIAGDG